MASGLSPTPHVFYFSYTFFVVRRYGANSKRQFNSLNWSKRRHSKLQQVGNVAIAIEDLGDSSLSRHPMLVNNKANYMHYNGYSRMCDAMLTCT